MPFDYRRVTTSLLLSLLFAQVFLAHVAASITGTVERPDAPGAVAHANLSVVVYAATGAVVEAVPLTLHFEFTLHALLRRTGLHVVRLVGDLAHEYDPLIVAVSPSGNVTSAYTRTDALELPSADIGADTSSAECKSPRLHFAPARHAAFRRERQGWGLSTLWRYRTRFVLAAALAFIMWFPRIYHKLPKEMKEELTGMKEPDFGDPNRVIKALIGEDPVQHSQTTSFAARKAR